MGKIKIFYIIDRMTSGAGTENQLTELIAHIDRNRFEPTIITLRQPVKDDNTQFLRMKCPHIRLHVNRLLSPGGLWGVLKLAALVRRQKVDIVHTFFVDSNFIGVLGGFLGGCRKIVVSRRDIGFWYTPKLLFSLRQLNRMADWFLTNCEAIKRVVIEKEKFCADRVRVIHNGIFNLPDEQESKLTKTGIKVPEDALLVGIVANLREVKRLDYFISLAAQITRPKTHFVIIGTGPLINQLKEQIKRENIEDKIDFTHTSENIYDYIKLFDVGVLTSESEGLSNALIEYQLCGIPAVAFNTGGNREIIEHGITGFLAEMGDLETMKKIVERLLNDYELRREIGKSAAKKARVLYSGPRMVKQTSDFYYEILGIKSDLN